MEKNQETLKEIEKKRKELGLSQVELAKRIGFSRGYYNMLIHGKKPVSDKLADQLQNVLQEYRKEKESGYGMQTEDLEEGFKSADDVWNIKEAGEMTDEYIEENEDSIAFDPVEWITNLEARRKSYGVSQNEYVETAGISRGYYGMLLIGKKRATKKLLEHLEMVLEIFNPDKEMEILFDYVRIRFATTDERRVIEDVMNIRMQYMIEEAHSFYGYGRQYIYGDITVMVSPEHEKGILLELKGKGCRQFEAFLKVQKRTWYDFFRTAREMGAVFKRIDIAINDRAGILNIPELAEKCRRDECITIFHSFKDYQSGELIRNREEDAANMGNTLYLGSLKSEIYFCIYEKDYEQYVKNGTPLDEAETKNRFEIRLKDERAEAAVDDLLEMEDVASMGNTLYLGSLKSEIYFCIYEKDYEQYVKNGTPLDEAETKNRFEIRLKDERAECAMDDLLEMEDVACTAYSIINHYVRFVDADPEQERRNWPLNERWVWFLNGQYRSIKLTTKPEEYTLDRTLLWLTRQVAPSLKMVQKLDDLRGTRLAKDMIEEANLSPHHKKILKQQQAALDDVVTARQKGRKWIDDLKQEYMES